MAEFASWKILKNLKEIIISNNHLANSINNENMKETISNKH